eukprot:Hpha_TRINITY_DN12712_c0_g1::TRINITY_DN12712_c0_g1_i1::g.114284::m.114284/K10406/KIFC2_3; kinesin family member C2/C3
MSSDEMERIKHLVRSYIESPDAAGDKAAEAQLAGLMREGFMQATLDSVKTWLRENGRPRDQLMALQLLDCLHQRGNAPLQLQLGSERWLNRLVQYGKACTRDDIRLRVSQLVVDWEFRTRGSKIQGCGAYGVRQLAPNGLPVPPPTSRPEASAFPSRPSSSIASPPLRGSCKSIASPLLSSRSSIRGSLPPPPGSGPASPDLGFSGYSSVGLGRPPPLGQGAGKVPVGTPTKLTKGMIKVGSSVKSPIGPRATEGQKTPLAPSLRRLGVSDVEVFMMDVNADLALVQLSIMRPEVASSAQVRELEQRKEQISEALTHDLPPYTAQALRELDAEIRDTLELRASVAASPAELPRLPRGVKTPPSGPAGAREAASLSPGVAPPPMWVCSVCSEGGGELERLRKALRDSEVHAQRLESDLEASLKERDRLVAAAAKQPTAAAPEQSAPPGLVAAIRAHARQTRRAAEFCRSQALEAAVQLEQCSAFLATRHAEAAEALDAIARIPTHERVIRAMQDNYLREMKLRKKYYNDLQELRGNIRVYCRVRPMIPKEISEGHRTVVEHPEFLESKDELVVRDEQGDKARPRRYEFDRVFEATETQEDVFRDTLPLIESVIDGYNVCIFAYGQTGSGKTHTMEGPAGDPGVNFRALQRLFEVIEERSEVDKSEVTLSVLEIYNEAIRDLLVDPRVARDRRYDVRMGGETGNYVSNLETVPVKSVAEIRKLCDTAHSHRSSGRTNMNEHSSRSHMILYFVVKTEDKATGNKCYGKLSLVDLAGSERIKKSQAEGQRAEEAKSINLSLTTLGKTIAAIGQKQAHVPYRESKLTHLLQDSLGGQSKVLMFANVSPASYNTAETCSTLDFATRAREVTLGKAVRNTEKRR